MMFVIRVQDSTGAPISGALLSSIGGPGPWQGMTDACGYFMPNLTVPGSYHVTVSKDGYTDAVRDFNLANPQDAPILVGLDRATPPFKAAPRRWRGNMCGIRLSGAPAVSGGASDPSLILSWFYDRYDATWRGHIRSTWRARGLTHILLSWPDAKAAGATPEAFAGICSELIHDGFFPCVFLASKDYDPADPVQILASLEKPLELLVGLAPMFCVGWELNLWLSPSQVQSLIDGLAPQWHKQPGTLGYVHFSSGYFAYQPDGQNSGAFWQAQVGNPPKLTGILHQRDPNEDKGVKSEYQARIADCLVRFNGGFNCPADAGDGHPFDFVALEITAESQFNGQMTEAEGDSWGQTAIDTPPAGAVSVMGSGNGQEI